jgi:hypothetical protein
LGKARTLPKADFRALSVNPERKSSLFNRFQLNRRNMAHVLNGQQLALPEGEASFTSWPCWRGTNEFEGVSDE